ncbi:uncharacterized protein DUF397 [Tamaricihabitans halophyticus]|uniref:Uncharacterized protein DUF397 n=1 Tax=Tamaricihabitans halophyticus TaxID=1262583 RepID=A0A4R2R5M3_9PSEU|nr:DUF397 domain-containing protein [Tamaricihabitans halophyticus]TCP54881.1 uncharacterized protein DUF397 [Tamaricihabitans halophyticus]
MAMLLAGARWRVSSYSNGSGGQCVEVAVADAVVGVRDSKKRDGGLLAMDRAAWQGFLIGVRANG